MYKSSTGPASSGPFSSVSENLRNNGLGGGGRSLVRTGLSSHSLLSGKTTGKFSKIGSEGTFRARIRQKTQRYRDGFPASKNREFGKSIRELFVAHQGSRTLRSDVYETRQLLDAFVRKMIRPFDRSLFLYVFSNRMLAARASIPVSTAFGVSPVGPQNSNLKT